MPTFAGRPSTMTGEVSAEFYGWTVKTANIGAAIRQIPQILNHFWIGRYDSKNQVTTCSDFPSEAMRPLDPLLERIFPILGCWTRRLLLH